MAAQMQEIIPQQGFELVLNKLGAVLLEEITAQKAMTGTNLPDFSVYIERTEPYDKGEETVFNVSLATDTFDGKNQFDTQGNCQFFIDIYTSAAASPGLSANDAVRVKIHKLAGIVRAILMSTIYKFLGLNRLVAGTMVNSIQFDDNYGNQEGAQIRVARITYSARVQENQEMWQSVALEGNDTTIKLAETQKGYKLIFNN